MKNLASHLNVVLSQLLSAPLWQSLDSMGRSSKTGMEMQNCGSIAKGWQEANLAHMHALLALFNLENEEEKSA